MTPRSFPSIRTVLSRCVPRRPVLLTNAEEDQWANPSGQFDVLKAAAPAYELYDLAKTTWLRQKMPETGSSRITGWATSSAREIIP